MCGISHGILSPALWTEWIPAWQALLSPVAPMARQELLPLLCKPELWKTSQPLRTSGFSMPGLQTVHIILVLAPCGNTLSWQCVALPFTKVLAQKAFAGAYQVFAMGGEEGCLANTSSGSRLLWRKLLEPDPGGRKRHKKTADVKKHLAPAVF